MRMVIEEIEIVETGQAGSMAACSQAAPSQPAQASKPPPIRDGQRRFFMQAARQSSQGY